MALATAIPLVDSTAGVGQLRWTVLQALPFMTVLAGVVALIVAAALRHRIAAAAAVVAIVLAALPMWQWRTAEACAGSRMSLMSFNAYVSTASVDSLSDAVIKHNVDTIVLVEANENFVEHFLRTPGGQRFSRRTTGTSTDASTGGTILSRLPLKQTTGAGYAGAALRFEQPAAEITVGSKTVVVQAVHPFPPTDRKADAWRRTLTGLGEWQRTHRGPVVMAGDFNASWGHPGFREAVRGMDSAGPTTLGFQTPTWPNASKVPPFEPLDHIMVRGLGSSAAAAVTIRGSDHRAVWSDLTVCGA
ncbi:hypothetical protein GCM10027579_09680 [Calidifontibacter terrae]